MLRSRTIGISNTRPSVVGTGFIVLDIIVQKSERDSVYLHAGGSCGNVLSVLAMLGWECWPIGRLGEDAASSLISEDLKKNGTNTEYVSTEAGLQTPVIIEYIKPGGIPSHTHSYSFRCPNCGSFFPQYRAINKEQAKRTVTNLEEAFVYYFDRTSPGALFLADYYRSRGSIIVFEPSSIGDTRLFKQALESAHVLKYSRQRLPDLSLTIGEYSVPLEVNTLGPDGLRYRFAKESGPMDAHWTELPAFQVSRLVDEAGSGDWCTAGFIYSLGRDNCEISMTYEPKVRSALEWGQALAALNCAFPGARGMMNALAKDDIITLANELIKGDHREVGRKSLVGATLHSETAQICTRCGLKIA